MSPTLDVTGIEVPSLPIAGPSWAGHAPLFEEPVGLGDDHVRMEAPAPSGK